ncbi:MAG: hypothetical protein RSD03_06765 [Lachnospiraceae bacterium]
MKLSIPDNVYKKSGMTPKIRKKIDSAIKKLESEYTIYLDKIEGGCAGKGNIFISGGFIDDDGRESLAETFVRYRNGEEIPEKSMYLIKKYLAPWRR